MQRFRRRFLWHRPLVPVESEVPVAASLFDETRQYRTFKSFEILVLLPNGGGHSTFLQPRDTVHSVILPTSGPLRSQQQGPSRRWSPSCRCTTPLTCSGTCHWRRWSLPAVSHQRFLAQCRRPRGELEPETQYALDMRRHPRDPPTCCHTPTFKHRRQSVVLKDNTVDCHYRDSHLPLTMCIRV